MNLLERLGIPMISLFQIEIFFETPDGLSEEEIERQIIKVRLGSLLNPDLADFNFTHGSPASSPYITVTGSSRRHVERKAIQLCRLLVSEGAQVMTPSKKD
jgi:hypothetical protein